jgi:Xaa-Pro aminopeptidase
MRALRPGLYEYEAKAIINYVYQKNGCERPGFPSICGSGPNSTVLHYEHYDRQMLDGDLLLVDIGTEYNYYSGDVTRTFPVNGTFTKEQREIYDLVLAANEKAIDTAKPGVAYHVVQDSAHMVLRRGLFELGLMTDPKSEWQEKVWSIHGFGHYLGLDVHDVGDYGDGQSRLLEPGMVFTIEPGLYFSDKSLTSLVNMMARSAPKDSVQLFIKNVQPVYEKYKNIGVRIEDDVLVTEDGVRVLSNTAPKSVPAIEKIMKEKSLFFR